MREISRIYKQLETIHRPARARLLKKISDLRCQGV